MLIPNPYELFIENKGELRGSSHLYPEVNWYRDVSGELGVEQGQEIHVYGTASSHMLRSFTYQTFMEVQATFRC